MGQLAHTSQVICPGKTFMRSLFKLQAGQWHCKPWHQIHLNVKARADLLWWSTFIVEWNGISIIPKDDAGVYQVWSNASGSWSCGVVSRDTWEWLQLPWLESTAAIGGPSSRVSALLSRNFCQWFWHAKFGGPLGRVAEWCATVIIWGCCSYQLWL